MSSWKNKTVLVCGGTSGLGLHIACASARQGAKVAIVGRSEEKLAEAEATLLEQGAEQVWTLQGDVLTLDACHDFHAWRDSHDTDLMVNAIGRSDRGSLMQLEPSDLKRMFDDNVVATWNAIRTNLSSLERAKGTIVNIGSLAGLIASPHLGGYCVTKFALTALTRQLRLELMPKQIHVMLVSPGPIQREDSHRRYDDLVRERGLEGTSASAPGGGANLKLIDAKILSESILKGAHEKQREMVVPNKVRWLSTIVSFWPALGERILLSKLKK